jgi:hypothetical protein
LLIPPDLIEADWHEVGRSLANIHGSSLWWIGDWLNHGERTWAESYKSAEVLTRFDYGTLRNAAYIAASVEVSRRRDKLSWSHHSEVAHLDPQEQSRWLHEAEKNNLTRQLFRASIKAGKVLTEDDYEKSLSKDKRTLSVEQIALSFRLWLNHSNHDKKPREWWVTVERYLRPLVEFYQTEVRRRVGS